ncbi:PRK06851 family protein [Moorella sp. ACPs]|uniref:PRK06851 family protein n=1 Tax=Neomoorella carbonis TaxID=3062783 RepID=UPI00324D1E2F
MPKGKLKKVFPGGNTCMGFYSFYDFIIEPDATRIFVVKGGPGVGKSTFMRKIGEAMLERGFDVEFHCCSSDNNSLDGVVIPKIRVAIIDGTAPHIFDPKNPGAVDEIIHLGDYWDEDKMRASKEQVLQDNARISRLYRIAYSALKEARVIRDEWESYVAESMIIPRVYQAKAELLEAIFAGVRPRYNVKARERHLFATALTPQGLVTGNVETLLQDIRRLFTIAGDPGTGVSGILAAVARMAHEKGLDTEVYHCPFDPNNIDMVIIPEIQAAAMNWQPPHDIDVQAIPGLQVAMALDLNRFIDREHLNLYGNEIASAVVRYQAALDRAIAHIREAKLTHDHMESYYTPAMDFAAINAKREEILQRILGYAAEMLGQV